jgi:DNA-binding transcriptional LysR family regulator
MDLFERMSTYVRVVEVGSFATAAKQLKLTSGAVSRQIASLEAELGVTLLARSTRAMSVTADGHRYHEQCLRVLREVAQAQAIGQQRGVEGTIRVGAPTSFGLAALVPHLTSLRAKHPALKVELSLEDRLLDVSLEGFDVLVRAGDSVPLSTGVVARALTSFPFVLVAAPAYLQGRGTPAEPEALASHDVLTCHVAAGPDVWTLGDGEREARVRVTDAVVFRCGILQAVREVALAGQGIALLPDWFARGDIERGALRPVLPGWRTERIPVSALYRATPRPATRVRAFVDHLVAALAEAPAPGLASAR